MATVQQNYSDTKEMLATRWYGKKDIRVETVARPTLTEKNDALLRITSTAICGSDLHMYTGFMPGMEKGDIIGHEFMGIVEEVGSGVTDIKKGDRVVAAFDFACGSCFFCKKGVHSSCSETNPKDNTTQEQLYGDRTGGLAGYSHVTGGYAGGQAEYARVPNADVNLLKIPADSSLPDDKVLFLSDIFATAWHAVVLGEVADGDKVAIWGAGPVGILAARLAQLKGASQVILIDREAYRLKFAGEKVPGIQTVNFSEEKDVVAKLKAMTQYGPDVAIEAVGCHYTKSLLHKVETAVGLETDSGDVINEMIRAVRKGGRISVVGVYVNTINHFQFGPLFEKGLSLKAGQTPCQKYWPELLKIVTSGKVDPSMVITHRLPLSEAANGYKIFNDKEEGCVKVVLKPGAFT
jgi:threonine dehydrogenase-like Zn-dependent dehydrogenase